MDEVAQHIEIDEGRMKDIFTMDGPKMAAIKPPERTVEIARALNRSSQSSVAANL